VERRYAPIDSGDVTPRGRPFQWHRGGHGGAAVQPGSHARILAAARPVDSIVDEPVSAIFGNYRHQRTPQLVRRLVFVTPEYNLGGE
jgi:hypothetical protein